MNPPFGVALLGCGTVGAGVAQLLLSQASRIADRAGRPVELRHVVVRDCQKPRPVFLPPSLITSDDNLALHDSRVDAVVELVGGTTWARSAVLAALAAGKHVVTANKALLAHHGPEVFQQAHHHHRAVAFEASVAGGVPIIGALTHGLAANEIQSIHGILNGTCNYILSQMTEHGHDYATALQAAQQLGYAEADPTLDVDGSDAAHKLAILARLAFQATIPADRVHRRGINTVTPLDVRLARELGYVFKLIADGRKISNHLSVQVGPMLVRVGTPLADVSGANNAIQVHGDAVGTVFLAGPGAGQMPTASAVVSDIIDMAIGRAQLTFNALRLWERCDSNPLLPHWAATSRFYLRLTVTDQPGVLAEVAALLAREDISVASVLQHEAPENPAGAGVTVVIMTHTCSVGQLDAALEHINASPHCREPGRAFPVMSS
jgi:homoserine dehydrogenase